MSIHTALLAWYDQHAADLPWRRTHDPYAVWLSEIMLQQTQVDTVIPYYERFLRLYPTVADLAAAPLEDVLKQWEGLGYYSRARHLHAAAQTVSREHAGQFPASVDGLLGLPGIGRYTAGAIASIAFGLRAPLLDGNVIRVFARLTDLSEDVSLPAVKERLWALAEAWLPAERTGDYNQALMELGRVVCKPRNPVCKDCPLQNDCHAYAAATVAERPVKAKKSATPHVDVAAGMVWRDDGRLLIAQRPLEGLLGGLWEFPGGKLEAGESLPECLQRELREELAIEVHVGELFASVQHAFTHFKITLHAFTCQHVSGEPQRLGVRDFAWVRPDELEQYAFGKADREVIRALLERKNMLL